MSSGSPCPERHPSDRPPHISGSPLGLVSTKDPTTPPTGLPLRPPTGGESQNHLHTVYSFTCRPARSQVVEVVRSLRSQVGPGGKTRGARRDLGTRVDVSVSYTTVPLRACDESYPVGVYLESRDLSVDPRRLTEPGPSRGRAGECDSWVPL